MFSLSLEISFHILSISNLPLLFSVSCQLWITNLFFLMFMRLYWSNNKDLARCYSKHRNLDKIAPQYSELPALNGNVFYCRFLLPKLELVLANNSISFSSVRNGRTSMSVPLQIYLQYLS